MKWKKDKQGKKEYTKKITKAQAADYVGMARSSFNIFT